MAKVGQCERASQNRLVEFFQKEPGYRHLGNWQDRDGQPRQSDRALVSGECHYFWGKCHRLNVVERAGRHEVKVSGGRIHLFINPGTSAENKMLVLTEFYRNQLKARIEKLITDWQNRMGVEAADWSVAIMSVFWRIWAGCYERRDLLNKLPLAHDNWLY